MNSADIQHIVYVDESGTGVRLVGSDPIPTLAGWIDTVSNWGRFKLEWQAVQDAYRERLDGSGGKTAQFHCSKIMARYAKEWRIMPWLPDYIHELAFVAARTAIPICSANQHIEGEQKNSGTTCNDDLKGRRDGLPSHFFNNALQEFKRMEKTGKIIFVFESGDMEWNKLEMAECLKWKEAYLNAGIEIVTPLVAGKHDNNHALPLQAADLLASVTRKAVRSPIEFSSHPVRSILCYRILQVNHLVNKQPPKHGPDGIPPTLPYVDFEPIMRAHLQRRLAEEMAKLQSAGDPNQTYCPFYGGICNPSEQV